MSQTRRAFFRTTAAGTLGLTQMKNAAAETTGETDEPGNWTFNETDALIAESVREHLPSRLFDIHAHLYRKCDLGEPCPQLPAGGPDTVDVNAWRTHLGRETGGQRLSGGLFLPYPVKGGDVDAGNDFLLEQVQCAETARGLVVVTPDINRAKVNACFRNPNIVGFKPYHVFAYRSKTFDAPLAEYLPEWVWEMADAHGAVILLHIVRQAALSDTENQRAVLRLCEKYPKANLLLAHAGRGFHAPHTIRALPALKGLNNIYFDSAAICEADALMAIVKTFGPRRLLWGSDFPISQQRGKCVTVGDAFSWICPRRIDIDPASPACHPTLVGLEALRAISLMAELMNLSTDDLKDIYFNNALRLLKIEHL